VDLSETRHLSEGSSVSQSRTPSFADLGLSPELVRSLQRHGMPAPFPIQAATVPDALAGRDVLGRGQTGSGKTLAFGLPLLERLAGGRARSRHPRGLVLVPTRELALQVNDALEPHAHVLGLSLKVVVGGLSMGKQIDALKRGVDIVIATPGRLTDLVERSACALSAVEVVVIDEADHMADMGFLPVVSKLLGATPSTGQRLLFSATLDGDVDTLVRRFLVDPVTHSTAPAAASVTTMEHHLLVVERGHKADVVAEIAGRDGRTLLFVRTKHGVDRLAKQLGRAGVPAGALHGGKTQNARNRTLADFRDGRVAVLVATDVAARGIHVDGVDLVLHVDPPADHKDYLHRAGRTARAGESGTVVTMVLPDQERDVDKMAQRAGIRPLRRRVSPGDEHLRRFAGPGRAPRRLRAARAS
jgi:superfamily II DNA/RNA helicase